MPTYEVHNAPHYEKHYEEFHAIPVPDTTYLKSFPGRYLEAKGYLGGREGTQLRIPSYIPNLGKYPTRPLRKWSLGYFSRLFRNERPPPTPAFHVCFPRFPRPPPVSHSPSPRGAVVQWCRAVAIVHA